ncbi:MAG: DUF2283 domain-containing protein [Patescibacteria group bacterium]
MAKISYDPEVQILSIRLLEKKSVDSDVKGNVVFDYDGKGNVVNIDVMNLDLESLTNKTFAKSSKIKNLN